MLDHGHSLAVRGPIADTLDQIFEPLRVETLTDLFAAYDQDRARMAEIAEIFDGQNEDLVGHFMSANAGDHRISTEGLFELEPALRALDASYWSRAIELTDIFQSMPQKRRDEWHELIRDHQTPPFDRHTVIATMRDLLAQRHLFFAERVDGIFRTLSQEHVTNRPEGFGKRMILAYVYNWYVDSSRCGYIHDLRCVIARFMGRDEPLLPPPPTAPSSTQGASAAASGSPWTAAPCASASTKRAPRT
jgi:hypothetical protein